jgi:hypothetical protein
MDKRDTLSLMNACMVLVVGFLGLGTCILLYLDHLQFQAATEQRIQGLEYQIKVLEENAERTKMQQLGRDDGVTEF